MKAILAAVLFSLGATSGLSAASVTDIGGGFGYMPTGSGNCQLLYDTKYNQPIYQFSRTSDSKVVVIGTYKQCPKEYNGYKATRLTSGQTNGFIFSGVSGAGRKLHIYRKTGSYFTFKLGPKPDQAE